MIRPVLLLALVATALNCYAAPTAEINRAAESLRVSMSAQRRDFHMHPELGYHEVRTSGIVLERLKAMGFTDIRTNVAVHGIVALLKGGKPGPVVAYRGEMDALPIQELNDVPYKSTVAHVMHACGHDAHTTIALGVADVLSRMRDELPGSVKFVFQPDEEGPPPEGMLDGAMAMVKDGALQNPRPLAIFGLHTTAEIETGQIGARGGGAQAAADLFEIVIHGKTAHPAHPEEGVDSILVASQCVEALQAIRSRRIDPLERVVLTIGKIQGGKTAETLAPMVTMNGMLRSFDEKVRTQMKAQMRQTLEGVCKIYGASFDLNITEETMVVYNEPKLTDFAMGSIRHSLGNAAAIEPALRMGAEDFSYYQQVVPGILFRLGSGNKARGITSNQHTATFDIDEECMVVGVKSMANLIWDYLEASGKVGR
ncbi:MAG: M20 metallopeptidase family protein [Limisphaerales bacterium]